MTTEIYNPPSASLTRPELAPAEFYVVSRKKFLLLFMATLGLYQLYWLYRNWKLQKAVTGLNVIPLLRAIFQIFFFHSLFRRIDHRLRQNGKKFYWNADSYATALAAMTIISGITDNFSEKVGEPLLQFVSIVLLPIIALTYLPAQQAINQCCGDPNGDSNAALSAWNYAWLTAGTIIWLATAFGIFITLQESGF